VSAPLVSIALVTRNGAATLPPLLEALARQRVDFPVEIVAVDSGSTDGSAELLARSVDRFVTIAPETFNHGLTRNLAIEQSRGDLVVLIVQDALPATDSWLVELTTPLRADARLAGTFARQSPRPDASGIAREYLARAPAASGASTTLLPLTHEELAALTPMDRLRRCSFDNVCSCIRRSVWSGIPFRETPIGEDIEWARDVLLAGYRLEFVPRAVVIHSHDRSLSYELARTRALHRRLFELFELRTVPTLPLLARAMASSLVTHFRWARETPGRGLTIAASARAIGLAVTWPLGQYLGGLAGAQKGR
jgi:glycosyltransferase involved in cell wall biosynthesis